MGGATVQANSVHMVLDTARRASLDVDALLARVGLTMEELAVPDARVSFAAHCALFDEAARELGDDMFGFRCGSETHPANFDVLGQAVMSCATLRDAFMTIARYLHVTQDCSDVALEVTGTTATATYVVRDVINRHEIEGAVASLFRFLDVTLGGTFAPHHASYAHAAAAAPAPYVAYFRAPVRWGQPFNGIVFDAAVLGTLMPRPDPRLAAILERQMRDMLARLPARGDVVADVRAALAARICDGEPAIDVVARGLAMSTRTLQRRLREAGTSFAEIIDEVRKELALRHLADRACGMSDAAFLLGYSELSTFHRAFRRWTGESPGEWRRVHSK